MEDHLLAQQGSPDAHMKPVGFDDAGTIDDLQKIERNLVGLTPHAER